MLFIIWFAGFPIQPKKRMKQRTSAWTLDWRLKIGWKHKIAAKYTVVKKNLHGKYYREHLPFLLFLFLQHKQIFCLTFPFFVSCFFCFSISINGSLGIAPPRNCTNFLKIWFVVPGWWVLFLLCPPRE